MNANYVIAGVVLILWILLEIYLHYKRKEKERRDMKEGGKK